MAEQKRYSDDERANALAALEANGGNVTRTSEQIGIPKSTLLDWRDGRRHPEASANATHKKADMVQALEAIAWKLIDAMPGKIADAKLGTVATSLGITIDKIRLLKGLPTSINEEVGGQDAIDLEKLTDEQLESLRSIITSAERRQDTGEAAPS